MGREPQEAEERYGSNSELLRALGSPSRAEFGLATSGDEEGCLKWVMIYTSVGLWGFRGFGSWQSLSPKP